MEGPLQFLEKGWSIETVIGVQAALEPLDDFLSFVSSASNPASVLHYLVPVLTLFDPTLALKCLVAYVAADVSNLAMKWPLRGDRPYWVDEHVRQFGVNTCEVGYGLPSGHVQVTAAVYLLLAAAARKRRATAAAWLLVGVTALSRVHMGAHTVLQVSAGFLAGLATAKGVDAISPRITAWASSATSSSSRLITAAGVVVLLALLIALENTLLVSYLEVDIYRSVQLAQAHCRGGLHGAVSSARGIARDVGALFGAAVGRSIMLAYALPAANLHSLQASKLRERSVGGGWTGRGGEVVAALLVAEAGLRVLCIMEASLIEASAPLQGAEGYATLAVLLKYILLLAGGTGVAPLLVSGAGAPRLKTV